MPSKYEGCPTEVAELSAYINLQRALNSSTRGMRKHLADSGLTGSQCAVMEALLHCGAPLQKVLSDKLLTSSGNVTFVIDGLEQRGRACVAGGRDRTGGLRGGCSLTVGA